MFRNEIASFLWFNFKIETIQSKKCIGGSLTDSFVSVDEDVVIRQRFHEGCCLFGEAIVVTNLGTKNGGLKSSLIPEAMRAAKLFSQLPMHFCYFGQCQVYTPWHLSKQFVEFSILINRPAEVCHRFGSDGFI